MTLRKCEHGRCIYYCVECYKLGRGGSQICACLKRRSLCKIHGGKDICKHEKKKQYCIECYKTGEGGSGICACLKRRRDCIKHGGKTPTNPRCLRHNKIKRNCRECYLLGEGGNNICKCLRRRDLCKTCNPFKYFIQITRNMLAHSFRRSGKIKDKRSLELLGIESFDQLKHFIAEKIETWNATHQDKKINLNDMAIDHIKPVSAFDEDDESKREVNHYTNLQPLPQDVNAHKSAKWSDKDEEFWRANIIGNAEFREIYLPCVMD